MKASKTENLNKMNRNNLQNILRAGIVWMLGCAPLASAFSQPRYDYTQLQRERLDRGVVAVKTAEGKVALSWRLLKQDAPQQSFGIYRNGQLLKETAATDPPSSSTNSP